MMGKYVKIIGCTPTDVCASCSSATNCGYNNSYGTITKTYDMGVDIKLRNGKVAYICKEFAIVINIDRIRRMCDI